MQIFHAPQIGYITDSEKAVAHLILSEKDEISVIV